MATIKSIEEKARLYDEAIRKAKDMLSYKEIRQEDIEYLFPELKESEDERIRKEMIFYFTEEIPQCSIQEHSDKMREFISWLKRQEVERIKLELKAGNSYFCYKSRWERADSETFKKGLIYKCNKDGVLDNFVIKNPEQHFIEIKDKRIAWLEKHGEQKKSYDTCDSSMMDNKKSPYGEKRDFGYFEEKPTDKIEPKFKVKYAGSEYNVLEVKDIAGVTYYGIEDEPNHIDYVLPDNCEIISGYVIKESGSLYPTKPAVFSEQNPAWGEEDEKEFKWICVKLQEHHMSLEYTERVRKAMSWLKSLKGRVQPKQEWSEEDEKKRNLLIAILNVNHPNGCFKVNPIGTTDMGAISKDELVSWLKSLRPQSTWKPNDGQMKALADALSLAKNCGKEIAFDLRTLHEQLKKLN